MLVSSTAQLVAGGAHRGVGNTGARGYDRQRLRLHREAAGISQSELARRAGIPRGYVSKYENGQAAPNADRLGAIAVALGREPLDFVDQEELGHGLHHSGSLSGFIQFQVADQAGPDMTLSRYRMLELGNVTRLTHADTTGLAAVFGVSPEIVRAAHQWDLDQATALPGH